MYISVTTNTPHRKLLFANFPYPSVHRIIRDVLTQIIFVRNSLLLIIQ